MGSTAAGPTAGTAPEGPRVPRRPGAARVKPGAARLGTRGTQGRAAGDSGDAGPSGRAGLRSLVCSLAAPGKAAGAATANAPFVSKTAGTNLESTVRAKGRHKGQILNDATRAGPLEEAHSEPESGTEVAAGWASGGRAVNGLGGEPPTLQTDLRAQEERRPRGDSRGPLWPAPSRTSVPEAPLRGSQASLPRSSRGPRDFQRQALHGSGRHQRGAPVSLGACPTPKGGRRTRRPGGGPPTSPPGLRTCCALFPDLMSPAVT